MKINLKIAALLLIICTSLSACVVPDNNRTSNSTNFTQDNDSDDVLDRGPVKGGTLKIFSTTPDTLNPVLTNNVYVQDFCSFVYESMVKLDSNQKPLPSLAEKWEISQDGLMWTFYLRENVLWHDNISFSADDVEFTVEKIIKSGAKSPYSSLFSNITTFSAVDRRTFRIILKKPYFFTAEKMTFPILPKHCFVGQDFADLRGSANMKPVGTGPYKFISYDGKSSLKLMSNDKWWGNEKEGKKLEIPYIAEIEVKVYPSVDDAINAFQSKDVDVAFIGNNEGSKYIGRSDLLIKRFKDKNYDFAAFNLDRSVSGDKAVRQAIYYAVDRVKLVNELLGGEAVASELPLIPDSWLYNTNMMTYIPSQSKAREILSQGDWKEKNGVWYKRINGVYKQLELEVLVNEENETRLRIVEALEKQLKTIGIKLNIKKVTWEEELSKVNSRKFDMALIGCRVPSIPDISFMYSSAEINGMNVAGFKNLTVDAYLQQILAEKDDSRKRVLFMNMVNVIQEEVPYLGLYFYNNAAMYNKRLKGDINPNTWDKFYNITKWYIPFT